MDSPLGLKVFLDTCVVNRLVEYGEYFFDNCLDGTSKVEYECRPSQDQQDIVALHGIVQVYQRACVPFYITPAALAEVSQASDQFLKGYAWEVFHHSRVWGDPDVHCRLASSSFDDRADRTCGLLGCFPDEPDRRIIAEAFVLGCDVFLTVDRRSILRYRGKMRWCKMRVLRPVEFWMQLTPFLPLVS